MTSADNILPHLRDQLGYARRAVKQAQLRGDSDQYDVGRVSVLAGLIASFDPEIETEEVNDFITRMFDVADMPEHYTPSATAAA